VGRALKNLLAFLLRYASEDTKPLALFLQLLVVVQAVEDFLLRFVTDGAGVVEDKIGFFNGFHLTVSLGNKCADNFFRVVDIHLTAEGFEVEGLAGDGRHTQ
jgi:hypothetical protein